MSTPMPDFLSVTLPCWLTCEQGYWAFHVPSFKIIGQGETPSQAKHNAARQVSQLTERGEFVARDEESTVTSFLIPDDANTARVQQPKKKGSVK